MHFLKKIFTIFRISVYLYYTRCTEKHRDKLHMRFYVRLFIVILRIEFCVARVQAKVCESCLLHVKSWSGLLRKIDGKKRTLSL